MAQRMMLTKGTRIRISAGMLGTVAALQRDGQHYQTHALVTADDGSQQRWLLPLAAFGPVESMDGQRVAQLRVPEATLARYLVRDATPAVPTTTSEADLHIPLAEEELTATTRQVPRGVVHLHTSVEMQEQHIAVPVMHETAVIERIPADQFDPTRPVDPDDIIIPITEERLVIQKETVVTEYIRIRKQRSTEKQVIAEQVRREILTVAPESAPNGAPDDPPLVRMASDYAPITEVTP